MVKAVYIMCMFSAILVEETNAQTIYHERDHHDYQRAVDAINQMLRLVEMYQREKRCQSPWIQFQKSCFLFGAVRTTWTKASDICTDLQGRLAELDTQEKDIFVRAYLLSLPNNVGYWIGGTKKDQETEWIWSNSSRKIVYTNWNTGQPDNKGVGENCLELPRGYHFRWNDLFCGSTNAFICETEI